MRRRRRLKQRRRLTDVGDVTNSITETCKSGTQRQSQHGVSVDDQKRDGRQRFRGRRFQEWWIPIGLALRRFEIRFSGVTDFIYAADTAAAFIACADRAPEGAQVFNVHALSGLVSNGASATWRSVLASGPESISGCTKYAGWSALTSGASCPGSGQVHGLDHCYR